MYYLKMDEPSLCKVAFMKELPPGYKVSQLTQPLDARSKLMSSSEIVTPKSKISIRVAMYYFGSTRARLTIEAGLPGCKKGAQMDVPPKAPYNEINQVFGRKSTRAS